MKAIKLLPQPSFRQYDHCYKTEIPVAGVNSTDITVLLHDQLLEVVIRPEPITDEVKNQQKEQIIFELPVPQDADIEFGSAEYRDNKLVIHLSRSADQLHCTSHELVVY